MSRLSLGFLFICGMITTVLTTAANPATAQPSASKPSAVQHAQSTKTMNTNPKEWARMPSNEVVNITTLTNKNKMTVNLIDFGAAMQSVMVPDKNGKLENVTLGFDNIDGYLKHKAHFGCTIGRFANRIAK